MVGGGRRRLYGQPQIRRANAEIAIERQRRRAQLLSGG